MVYLSTRCYDFDLNDPSSFQLNNDLCSITSTPPIPIMPNTTSPYQHHQKDIDEYLNMNTMNSNRISFTEFLSTDNMMEAYGIIHATSCSSPESVSDNYMFVDDPKIKMEYTEPLDSSIYNMNNMSRTLSSDSCPELAGCNQPTAPLTPIDSPSPHDQSPIMTPPGLPMSHHHQYHHQQLINDEVMIETPSTTTKRGRGRRAATATTVMTNATISGMQLQDPQEYQHSLMGSSSLPSPPQKTTGKSRGRRMTNKPAKPGTKSFECTYASCGRVFKRSEHLKRHIRSIHTLERPFHCPHPHCSKRFSRSDNLSQHVRVHRPNGKEKNATARSFSNFTPFLQTYPNGNLHTALQQQH